MNTENKFGLIFFISITFILIFIFRENINLTRQMANHQSEYAGLQENLKERRKNQAVQSALEKSNVTGFSKLVEKAHGIEALPAFIKELDQKMAGFSLFREEVSYVKKETAGSFSLVRVQLNLTGAYDEFRRFLADVERNPNLVWIKSVQAVQDKSFLRFMMVLQVLVRNN